MSRNHVYLSVDEARRFRASSRLVEQCVDLLRGLVEDLVRPHGATRDRPERALSSASRRETLARMGTQPRWIWVIAAAVLAALLVGWFLTLESEPIHVRILRGPPRTRGTVMNVVYLGSQSGPRAQPARDEVAIPFAVEDGALVADVPRVRSSLLRRMELFEIPLGSGAGSVVLTEVDAVHADAHGVATVAITADSFSGPRQVAVSPTGLREIRAIAAPPAAR